MKNETKEKKIHIKPETPIELLRRYDKAMQVGPQLHLRKKWAKPEKLLGGTEKRK